jgi:hypothetical protein
VHQALDVGDPDAVDFTERGILLTPVVPTCSVWGYGRLSSESG